MVAQVVRLSRLFTPTYAARVNAQIVYPAESIIVKPNELESALARPLHVAAYEPDKSLAYLAAQISYGIIKGHPFMDGNKRTAFFLANEYLRALGPAGLAHQPMSIEGLHSVAERHIAVAKGDMEYLINTSALVRRTRRAPSKA